MGVSLTTVEALRAADHDAVHLRDEGLIRLPDPEIAAKAVAESRIVLTFDLDFGDILATARSEGSERRHFSTAKSDARRRKSAALSGDRRRARRNSRAGRSLSSKTKDFASGGYRYGPDFERSGTATPLRNARRTSRSSPSEISPNRFEPVSA